MPSTVPDQKWANNGRNTKIQVARLIALSVSMALSFTALAIEKAIQGHVVGITDGDTITLLVDNRQMKVRLAEIDAPESKQAFGTRSRQSLADLCFQKTAVIEQTSKDRYGRVVGKVMCAGIDANAAQIQRGMAWVYEQYAKHTSPLRRLQEQAQSSKQGLWSDPSPVEPWKWRRR